MTNHAADIKTVLAELSSNPASGLSPFEATTRLEKYGPNRLRQTKKKTLAQRFAAQFKDAMIIILIVAAVVSFGVAVYERNPREFFEPALIMLIVILNATMGVIQESKAEKALDALKSLTAPRARVFRGGTELIIDASELVPGDIIRLEAGDFVPADARLLRTSSLKVEEAALTGESVPAQKDALAQVNESAAWRPCKYGLFRLQRNLRHSVAVVTHRMSTEIGRSRTCWKTRRRANPLQAKLEALGKYLGFAAWRPAPSCLS